METQERGKVMAMHANWRLGHGRFTRDVDSRHYAEVFLICAVSTVIAIRSFLALAGYPQVGNETLHIAHMLWGGLLMLIALFLVLTFRSRVWMAWAAILGGIGFGTFIDELGKFITSDNDYFFQPTIALIYIIFVALYLVTRFVSHRTTLTADEAIAYALTTVQEAVLGTLDEHERQRALRYLDELDQDDEAVQNLQRVLTRVPARTGTRKSLYARTTRTLATIYRRTIALPIVQTGIAVVFILSAISSIGWILVPEARDEVHANIVSAVGVGLSGAFNVYGVIRLRRSRYEAFRWFERSLLISIFVTQVFLFNDNGLIAIFGLAGNLLLLGAIKFALGQERAAVAERDLTTAPSPAGSPVG